MTIQILISPINCEEVNVVLKGNPDIVDIKNPAEGSLGANFPYVIKRARILIDEYNKLENTNTKMSVVIGDFPNLPGTASLAALGAVYCGADYIKIGIMGPKSKEDALYLCEKVVETVKKENPQIQVVIAGYADQYQLNTSVDPLIIPEITSLSGADIAMIDTAVKDGKSLFDHMNVEKLSIFIDECKKFKIHNALAGSLGFSDIIKIKSLNPDIIGVRSMVCEGFDRVNGKISPYLIEKLKEKLSFD